MAPAGQSRPLSTPGAGGCMQFPLPAAAIRLHDPLELWPLAPL